MKEVTIEGIIEQSELSGEIPELLGSFSQEEIERLLEAAGLTISVKYYGVLKPNESREGAFETIVYGIRALLIRPDSNNGYHAPNPRVGWQLKFPEPLPLDFIFGGRFQNVKVSNGTIEIRINGIAYSINKITGASNYPNR